MLKSAAISAFVKGDKLDTDYSVQLWLYGPRGGTRALETLSLEAAKELHSALACAIGKIERLPGKDKP